MSISRAFRCIYIYKYQRRTKFTKSSIGGIRITDQEVSERICINFSGGGEILHKLKPGDI